MPRAKSKKEEPTEAESDIVMEEAPTSHQPESRDDMSVDQDENDDVGDVDEDEIEEEEEEEVQRVRLVRGFSIGQLVVFCQRYRTLTG
jgi:DNA-directed RNA polymerase I and III subunit RPAC2